LVLILNDILFLSLNEPEPKFLLARGAFDARQVLTAPYRGAGGLYEFTEEKI